jgi:tRNA threonylcarbamoyladenosine biosynthesis protein TsaB
MVDHCLSFAGLHIDQVDLFACAVGPGSFTGLRIGVGLIKAFAHASGKPVVGVNTLDALAMNAFGTDEMICPIIDARRGDVYTATYHGGNRITEICAIQLDHVLSELQGKNVVFLGDAASLSSKDRSVIRFFPHRAGE